ncbi:MAG: hypothetical protein ACP5PZ_04660 [Bacteroidales bacterium]
MYESMDNNPILFNALKHHLATIKYFVDNPPLQWRDELVVIGHSLIDLYVGHMLEHQIIEETMKQLKQLNVLSLPLYETWIGSMGYRLIHLSDGSIWTLRRSKANNLKYIHIHPARNSPFTLRVKSETIKTAIAYHCLKYYQSTDQNFLPGLTEKTGFTETLNFVRKYIGLSPVKKAEQRGKIHWLICSLNSE